MAATRQDRPTSLPAGGRHRQADLIKDDNVTLIAAGVAFYRCRPSSPPSSRW